MPDVFPRTRASSIPIAGSADTFPVHRIFCVGRNYAAHAAEMGNTVDRQAPFYFTKSPASMVLSGAEVPYPSMTSDLHHEMELAVFVGASAQEIAASDALDVVYGYGCALDLTRRDLQAKAKEKARPWAVAKDFENSAVIGPVTPTADFGAADAQYIRLDVNGVRRQDANLAEMIHDVPAILADLSMYYHLQPGDVILTGTPAGVGPLQRGDYAVGMIEGLEPVEIRIQS